MTSERKIRANRANARASSGPKTAQGRARAARNSLRHALSLPVYSNPILSKEMEALVHEIVGSDANAEKRELARRIAEAQIDLCRVRRARHRLLTSALSDPDYVSPAAQREEAKSAARLAKVIVKFEKLRAEYPVFAQPLAPLFDGLEHRVHRRQEGRQKFATILSDMSKQLAAMDRYERRALSRRKFAIRAFDAARARAGTT